jgi:hypothetical protein
MTLPSRLKASREKQVTLTQLEGLLNVNGNQKIACLQLSVSKPEFGDSQSPSYPTVTVCDPRQTGGSNKEDTTPAGLVTLDMDLSPREIGRSQKWPSPKVHTFGQVEVVRGTPSNMTSVDSAHQLRQRLAGLPVVQRLGLYTLSCGWGECRTGLITIRYCTTLGHPLLDSSPGLFCGQEPQSAHATGFLVVHTSLSTTSSVATRIKSVQSAIRGLVGLDEREAMSNELGEIREAYEEGWDSGSDEGDD